MARNGDSVGKGGWAWGTLLCGKVPIIGHTAVRNFSRDWTWNHMNAGPCEKCGGSTFWFKGRTEEKYIQLEDYECLALSPSEFLSSQCQDKSHWQDIGLDPSMCVAW